MSVLIICTKGGEGVTFYGIIYGTIKSQSNIKLQSDHSQIQNLQSTFILEEKNIQNLQNPFR